MAIKNQIASDYRYSPAVAEQANETILKLKSDIAKRRLALIFLLASLPFIISFALHTPTVSRYDTTAHFVEADIPSMDDFLLYYDSNTRNIASMLGSLSISRDDLKNVKSSFMSSDELLLAWPASSNSSGSEVFAYNFTSNSTQIKTYFQSQPLTSQPVFEGVSSSGRWFAIAKYGGNILLKPQDCNLEGDQLCIQSNLRSDLSAKRVSTSSSASNNNDKLEPDDETQYTLTVYNESTDYQDTVTIINLQDALEYSDISEASGGSLENKHMLTWPSVSIPPNDQVQYRFVTKIKPTLPVYPESRLNEKSFDCLITISYLGSESSQPLSCPLIKQLESKSSSNPPSKLLGLLVASAAIITILSLNYQAKIAINKLTYIKYSNGGV